MNIEKGLKIACNSVYTITETVVSIINTGIVYAKVPDGKLQDFLGSTAFYGTIVIGEILRPKVVKALSCENEPEDLHIVINEEIGS